MYTLLHTSVLCILRTDYILHIIHHLLLIIYKHTIIYVLLPYATTPPDSSLSTVSFHNLKSQNFKSSVSNPESKYAAYLSVLSQISNCQGLGRKNEHEILKTDRTHILRVWTAPWGRSPRRQNTYCFRLQRR